MEQILKIRWTLVAAKEFEETIDYLLVAWNEETATGFTKTFLKKIAMVARFQILEVNRNIKKIFEKL